MSAFDNITNKIAKQNEELNTIKKNYMESLQKDFHIVIKSFFEDCPLIQAVVWSQYTPYFNDGDECVFDVNVPSFITKNFDIDDLRSSPYEYEDEDEYGCLNVPLYVENWDDDVAKYKAELSKPTVSEWAKGYYPKHIAELEQMKLDYPDYDVKIKAFANILSNNKDILKEIYGDHVCVYVTPNEVIIEEYSHD